MNSSPILTPVLACILMAGCTEAFTTTYSSPASPVAVEVPTPVVDPTLSVANQADIGNTCAAIAAARGTAAAQAGIAELRLRAGFSETELGLISGGGVAAGMSERAAICALGGNSNTVTAIKTITAPGHVTKVFTFTNGTRLYTDNGVVTVVNL
jgi:hypothetical protein